MAVLEGLSAPLQGCAACRAGTLTSLSVRKGAEKNTARPLFSLVPVGHKLPQLSQDLGWICSGALGGVRRLQRQCELWLHARVGAWQMPIIKPGNTQKSNTPRFIETQAP